MKSERSEWHSIEEYHDRHLSPTPHALARHAARADIAHVTDDTPPPAETEEQRRERAEREAFEQERELEKRRPRFNPLYFGIVAATIQMAITLWLLYG